VRCDEARRFAHLYIDGEFDERERALFEEHLADCTSCRAEVNSRIAFQKAVQKKLTPARMPAQARERVLANVQLQAQRANGRFKTAVAVAAAAAAVLGITATVLYSGFWSKPDALSRIVEESVAAHEASLPPEVEGNSESIRGYLEKQVELAENTEVDPDPPLKENERTRLIGVRLTRIGKDKALLYRYLHKGRDISVVRLPRHVKQFAHLPRPATGIQKARVLYNGAQNGHSVTLFESPGYTNAVVGDIPQPELLKLIPASL